MRSFRTSPWDPYENLPKDYARIFDFEDFKRTERDVQKIAEVEGVEVLSLPSVLLLMTDIDCSPGGGLLYISKVFHKQPPCLGVYLL